MKNSEILLNWQSWQEVGSREKKYAFLTMPHINRRDLAEFSDELNKLDLPYKLIVSNKQFDTLSKSDIDELIQVLEDVRNEKL